MFGNDAIDFSVSFIWSRSRRIEVAVLGRNLGFGGLIPSVMDKSRGGGSRPRIQLAEAEFVIVPVAREEWLRRTALPNDL
mmetsp:Transcript_26449/g.65456  ORF Transcript_26449/g.65456 Transcript_26449/m.65456 type:complete len:80 (+) Transcript_26449:531-770(+)